jgi:uncharacterized membrane protein YeiH
MLIHVLDFIGVFAFAIFGSYKALEKKFNIYGIIVCAALTALGGGTIREVILHRLPVYFSDHAYLYVTLSAALLTIVVYEHFAKIRSYALLMDALGLAVFSFIGAQKAGNAGLGCVGMIFFASITAAGGGILTDIITGDKPTPFTCEMYVLPAASGGCLYRLLDADHPTIYRAGFILLIPLAMRIVWLAGKGDLQLSGRLIRHTLGLSRRVSPGPADRHGQHRARRRAVAPP